MMILLWLMGCEPTPLPTAGFVEQLDRGLACDSVPFIGDQIGQVALLNADATLRLQLYPQSSRPDDWGDLFVGARLNLVFSDDDACDDMSSGGLLDQRVDMVYSISQGSLSWSDDGDVRRVQMLDVVFSGAPSFAEFHNTFTEDDALNAEDLQIGDRELPGVVIGGTLQPLQ